MSRSTFSVLFYVNRGKEKGGTTRLSVSGRVPRHCASDTWWLVGVSIVLFFLIFFLTVQIYDQSKEIDMGCYCDIEFSHWGKADIQHTVCRFVTSWATPEEDINQLKRLL